MSLVLFHSSDWLAFWLIILDIFASAQDCSEASVTVVVLQMRESQSLWEMDSFGYYYFKQF